MADHVAHQLGARHAGGGRAEHAPAVAQHGDAIGDLEDLVEPMRDEQHEQAAPLQLGDGVEQAQALLGRQHRGGLVEREDARRRRQGARDLDELARRDAERAGDAGRIERQPEFLEQSRRPLVQGAAIEQAPARARLAAEPDVLGDGQLRQHGELLVHRGDAGGARLGRRIEAHRAALDQDRAAARRIDAGQQVHQGRLAGAVGAGERVNLAAGGAEVDSFERRDRAEALAEAADLEQRCRQAETITSA